jgi:hypothetical protein
MGDINVVHRNGLHYYEKLDAMTIYAKEGNGGVKKVIQSLLKMDPENQGVITL